MECWIRVASSIGVSFMSGADHYDMSGDGYRDGILTVETDMADIGTGSYTIIVQTAAEMMGLDMTAGVYAACMKLREVWPTSL